jgi:hypothetical protein
MFEIISTPAPEAPAVDVTYDTGSGEIVLHRLERSGLTRVGSFRSAAEAWAALDQIDAPVSGRLAA